MDLPRSQGGQLLYAGQLLALIVTYVVLGKLDLAIDPVRGFATLIWPPTGIALAALLIGGYRLWPGIGAGTFVASLWMGATPLAASAIAAAITLEAVFKAFALQRILGFRASFDRFTDVVFLAAVAGVGAVISATASMAILTWGGVSSTEPFARTWLTCFSGDLVGDLVIVPVLLTWSCGPRIDTRPVVLADAAALGAFLVILAALVFYPRLVAAPPIPVFPSFMFLPLTWAALRFGTRGAATAMFVLGVAVVSSIYSGHCAFVRADRFENIFTLHLFLATASLTSLAAGAAVSDAERSRRALNMGESLFRALVESTIDAVYVKDRDGRFLSVNATAARLAGVPAETLIGQTGAALFLPGELQRMHELDEEVMRTGQPRTAEEIATMAGTTRVYHSIKVPYRDRAGDVIGLIGISRDITARKAEEQAHAWLAAIVESCGDAVIGMSFDGTITSWNAAAARLYGYPREEAIGQSISFLIPLERRDELSGLFDRVRRGERIENHETIRRRNDGTKVDVALTLSPVCDAAAAVIGVSAIHRDITELQERQRLALEAAQLGMWFWNLRDNRLVWTPLSKSLFGLGSDDEVSLARVLAMVHPDDRERVDGAIRRSLAERVGYQIEYRVIWPDGSLHWISARGRTFCDQAGAPVRMLGTMLDVTPQKRAEQERAELLAREQAALAEAQAATRAKNEFLAVLSHELRTPLQSMFGWTQILRTRIGDVGLVQKGLATIERNIKTQTQLIEDLLDVSRIVAGNLRLALQQVDLAAVLASSLESVKAAAEAKSIRLDASIEPVAGAVLGDPDRLQQVVANLLTNAVKFTPSGGWIGVRLERIGTTGRLIVEDTGCGMSPELLPYVFDRFRQGESGSTRRHGGLGLGLAIVRHLVEMHGGAVKAESPGEGRGATFTVTLPLVSAGRSAVKPERGKESGERPPVDLEGVRVLVVDDDPDARELLGMVLRESGAEVHAVHSARAAIGALASFHPDLLLSDIGMPDEDGYSLIREVRARESAEGHHIPAIALTAFASHADREEALALGFEVHLTKPANADDLRRTVASLVGRAA